MYDRLLARASRDESGCLIWHGGVTARGYTQIWDGAKVYLGHRVVVMAETGEPIPEGMTVDHLCGVKRCIEITHLEVVSRRENWERALAAGRMPWIKRERTNA
jgi:hypothetical protein